MKQHGKLALSNAKIAIVFFVFLAFVVGVSLIFKIIAVVSASRFDDAKRFTFTIANSKNIEAVSLSSDQKNIAVFKLKDRINSLQAGKLLEIPIDGFVESDSLDLNQKVSTLFTNLILKYNKLKTNLTIIDLLKITIFAKVVPESAVNIKTVEDARGSELNKLVGRLAGDSLIEKDHQTIQITNATDISGLGNRLARLITNMGGNVIIVATENSLQQKSAILYIDKKTYTVEKLQKVLGYETIKKPDNAISDITIIIGRDKLSDLPF